jgi:putative endonuclease
VWHVYIVKCADRTLYTGVAKNVEARIEQHNSGQGAKYTRTRRPVELVYRETAADRSTALQREHAIKRMRLDEKTELIRTSPEK